MKNLAEKLTKIPFNEVSKLPDSPGVYVFYKAGTVIYIGKAINLKRRVSSYFDLDLAPKTAKMVSEATALGVVKVTSELEALLLEAKLIRKYMPHYNIAAKDDKHPLYIVITKEKYPRVITVRKVDLNKSESIQIFGPFPSTKNVRFVLRILRRIFPYSDHKIGKRGCLYSHIGLCNPCPSEVENLENNTQKLEARKNYLKNLRRIRSVLSGKFDGVKNELEREMQFLSDSEKFEQAINVREKISALDYITRPQMPTEYYMENPNLYEDQRNLEIKDLKNLLENYLKIKNLNRIECFDIAHLSGTNPTASMVTFINGESDKNYYRHFKIKEARGGDDYDSMREVARRRLNHLEDWGKPDLIIVDGGKGQVKASSSVFTGSPEVSIIGIAKHPDRLILNDTKIKLTGSTLNLISRIRDEAHRFARRYHHTLISKSIISNEKHT